MIGSRVRPLLGSILLVGLLLNLSLLQGTAYSQSSIVFVTNEALPGDGSTLTRFDQGSETYGVGAGPSTLFQGVTVLNGQVLVADYFSDVIQKFSLNGTHLGTFASYTNATYVESDSAGNVYATAGGTGIVPTRFDSAGLATDTFTHVDLTLARGIDADVAGNVYVADPTNGLFKFASDGTFLNNISLGAINPRDMAIDESADLLYLADSNDATHGVKIFDISGLTPSLTGSMATPADSYIQGIHFAAESSNILVTDLGANSNDPRGLEFSPGGVLLEEYRPTGVILAFDIATYVPEPSSLVLLVAGMFGVGLRRRQWIV